MEENYKDKRGISELFDVPIKTLNNDLTEMRRTEFNVYILRPSHKRVYINVQVTLSQVFRVTNVEF
ncbi:DNA-binding protein [Lactococcus lactis]|uniref:DNA-binding protein n=1 Tax=Lactococcus lactis TaxID=1358 RepID=UPI0021A913D7|nr:DNA-binding protein [Lactococcus lactis]MCT3107677.1 DNA-binding protein [Lactococcus lactis]